MKLQGVIAGFVLLHYDYSHRQGHIGALALHPGLTNWLLKSVREEPVNRLLEFAEDRQITTAIVSDRTMLFAADELRHVVPTLFDWTDSMALYYWRALGTRFRNRNFAGLLGFLRDYQTNIIAEAYYGRRATLNAVVSPVDKLWFDRTTMKKSRNRVWMNGTHINANPLVKKIPKRLIFSGTMDYAPNYEGALWFLDNVFPQVSQKVPDLQVVIAGINPVPALSARATEAIRITGFVPDLGSEIARSSLYVAPLFTGGGFRNKIVEAIINGTYVIGSSISVEFLPDEFRSLLTVADSAEAMTAAILDYLQNPGRYSDRLRMLRRMVRSQFSWSGRSQDLIRSLLDAEQIHAKQRAGRQFALNT